MSIKTIECRIAAKPESLKYLWELMTFKNTPLINELLAQVPNHPDFEEWFEKGTLPQKPIKELCASLREKEPFANQSGRFYSSAIAQVHYTFESWLKVQKKLRQRIEGKQRWLAMLKSDRELETESGKDLAEIRLVGLEILQQIEQQIDSQKDNPKKKQKKRKKREKKLNLRKKALLSLILCMTDTIRLAIVRPNAPLCIFSKMAVRLIKTLKMKKI